MKLMAVLSLGEFSSLVGTAFPVGQKTDSTSQNASLFCPTVFADTFYAVKGGKINLIFVV